MDTEAVLRQRKIMQGLAGNESMLLADLIRASGLGRVQFTPALRQLLNQKRLSVRVVSGQGSSISQRVDGHIGKKLFIVPFNGAPVVATEDAVDDGGEEMQQLKAENSALNQQIKELEQRCESFGRLYSEAELRQIVAYLQQ
ncbi:hypothetical protein SIN8267_00255 [Sinobacterium norvegicum]|uniref:Uncharacterized protein n=1 Tax=Sinobacterium norvegicum TaxID=1641715 RepID=A0ABN8ECF5_9GAMM|nr:hypothetical protein [Sinobacterium norvegicum]CAH0990170.1 hypothetical protein SIN8267_00255 [Sinobacterium norvegicum]